jgi:hypothetical protein
MIFMGISLKTYRIHPAFTMSSSLSPTSICPKASNTWKSGKIPYYWINGKYLFNAKTGQLKDGISPDEAISIVKKRMAPSLKRKNIELITAVDKHHEYREKPLPAYMIEFEHPETIKAYVSKNDGRFITIRHESWRWFDFLWMIHTMDYESRDNFNTFVLRAFSLFGLITVISGFVLWFISSPTVRKFIKKRI